MVECSGFENQRGFTVTGGSNPSLSEKTIRKFEFWRPNNALYSMKLAYWMYAGPAHLGTLRVASSFKNVHAIMHAPLGDDYFNVMRSMLERERDFTPVTASIVDRHVLARGSQEKVVDNIARKDKEEKPDLIVLTPTCTSSILQEDLQNFVARASTESRCDVILADVNHYRVNEIQAADRTLEQIVRFYLDKVKPSNSDPRPHGQVSKTPRPSVNILGVFTLGFHNTHDCRELKRVLSDLGIEVNEIVPEGCRVENLKNLPKAWFNIVPYREIGLMTARYLQKEFDMPYVSTTPMGVLDTARFIREVGTVLTERLRGSSLDSFEVFDERNVDVESLEKRLETYIDRQTKFYSQAAWFSRSIDCQNLTGKKTVVFGDATHAASFTRILVREMGVRVVCAGTYCKHDADWFREQVLNFCDEVLITEDHTLVAETIRRIEPSAIFGTQMERHVGKRLDIPCGVISAPVHIQNFPLGYRPFLGYEGANQIADLVYNSFTLGMEDHLLEMFNGHDTKSQTTSSFEGGRGGEPSSKKEAGSAEDDNLPNWSTESLSELNRVPGFVRGKVKRNVETFAIKNKIEVVTLEVMYAAKEAASIA